MNPFHKVEQLFAYTAGLCFVPNKQSFYIRPADPYKTLYFVLFFINIHVCLQKQAFHGFKMISPIRCSDKKMGTDIGVQPDFCCSIDIRFL